MTGAVSIIGSKLAQPLADVLQRLVRAPAPGAGPKPPPIDEAGHSATACLLVAVILESFVMRARYLDSQEDRVDARTVHDYLAKRFPDFLDEDKVRELFVLRDSIAHNHLWLLELSDDRQTWGDIIQKEMHELTERYKDRKYEQAVDPEIARTRMLCLHVIPTQIDRSDVQKVLRVLRDALGFLDAKRGPILGVTANIVQFDGSLLNLLQLTEQAIRAI